MPCSDSSSSMTIMLDQNENFISFEYGKITCGREITAGTGLNRYFVGWTLERILSHPFATVKDDLKPKDDEAEYVMYLEWDVLRSAIAAYLGIDDPEFDADRCMVSAVEHSEQNIEIALVVLPPKELPKILPCSLGDKKNSEEKV